METLTPSQKLEIIMAGVRKEMNYAEKLHGRLPAHDPVRCVAIMSEEAGESVKAVLDWTRAKSLGVPTELITELRQTAAVCLRYLAILEDLE